MSEYRLEANRINEPNITCSPSGECAPNYIFSKGGCDKEILSLLWLEITEKCNLKCLHCYSDSSADKPLLGAMRYSDWCNCLRDARSLSCKSVMFIGGEPTLHPQLSDLIVFAYELGYIDISITTNGFSLSNRAKEAIKKCKATLVYSIYSKERYYHDQITTKKGSLKNSVMNIVWALEHQVSVAANIIQMDNDKENTKNTVEYLRNIGVKDIRLDRLRNVGRGSDYRKEVDKEQLCGSCGKGRLCVSSSGQVYRCIFDRERPVGYHKEGLSKSLERSFEESN